MSPSLLKDNFSRCRILDRELFSLSILNISVHCPVTSKVSGKKSDNLTEVLLPLSCAFKMLSLSFKV